MPPQPPTIITQDDSSDDHFSSASEGTEPKSPIPLTRVERVDDNPSYGEVPGTPAYNKRLADAVPDEIEIVPDGQRSRSGTRSRAMSSLSLSESTNTGPPVPKTIVERVDDKPAHGEVEGTAAHDKRLADAEPDEVVRVQDVNGSAKPEMSNEVNTQAFFHDMWEGKTKDADPPDDGDFDDFAEEGDDDFGDFDEADITPSVEPVTNEIFEQLAGMPELDFSSPELIRQSGTAYLEHIFPDDILSPTTTNDSSQGPSPFLSERSLSLWQQLVSPPPMQPPNWTRSRIRRLFLVSLGVPVDLDEILPPSKQKRLILPNINLASPRASTVMERLRDGNGNDSTTSIDSKSSAPRPHKPKRVPRGPAPPPDFDLNAAALLCNTTTEALEGFSDGELTKHLGVLETLNKSASSVLEYWLIRKDEGLKEKEALEGVIENLVGFVKGRRGM